MRHLTPSLSPHISTSSLISLYTFLPSSPTICLLHVATNVGINLSLERACILCIQHQTIFSKTQKAPLENQECRLGKHTCSHECRDKPGCGAGLYSFARKKSDFPKNAKKSIGNQKCSSEPRRGVGFSLPDPFFTLPSGQNQRGHRMSSDNYPQLFWWFRARPMLDSARIL
jgi:hypothetical protein